MLEEREFRQQAFDADQLPAGRLGQHVVEIVEARNRIRRHAEALLVVDELGTGTTLEDLALTLEQDGPVR